MDSSSGAIATRIDDITLGPTILNQIGLGGELAAPWGGLGRSLEVCVCVSVCGTWPLLGGTWPLLGGGLAAHWGGIGRSLVVEVVVVVVVVVVVLVLVAVCGQR